jgi:micrococcal nuclease
MRKKDSLYRAEKPYPIYHTRKILYNHFSMRNAAISILLILLAAFCAPCFAKEYTVSKVIDGDTIVLETGEHVRYLGIDAPELDKKQGGPAFYAREAANNNKQLVLLKKVRLEFDVERKDAYGRLLAYVFVKDLFVNGELVKRGCAQTMIKPPNVKYRDLLVKYQNEAMSKEIGLWQEKKTDTASHYVGNKRSYIFHRPDCSYAAKVPEKNRIIFRNRLDAIKVGYAPCKRCKP